MNRGRGIKLIDNLQSFFNIVYDKKPNKSVSFHSKPKIRKMIVQKYLENPFLYNNRKFDIRVWVLLNYDMKVYFYMDGYIRTSSELFTMDNLED